MERYRTHILILSILLWIDSTAEPLLRIIPDKNGSLMRAVAATISGARLYVVTDQRGPLRRDSLQESLENPMYKLESRSMNEPYDLVWKKDLNKLIDMRSIAGSRRGLMPTYPVWHVAPRDDLAILLFSPPVMEERKLGTIYSLSVDGSIILKKSLELHDPSLPVLPRGIVQVKATSHGLIILYSGGITVLDYQGFSEVAGWRITENKKSEGHVDIMLSIDADKNHVFVLGGTIQIDNYQASIWIKKFSLHSGISLEEELVIEKGINMFSLLNFNIIAFENTLTTIGINNKQKWMTCEIAKREFTDKSCSSVEFPTRFYQGPNSDHQWVGLYSSAMGTSNGYVWNMYSFVDGALIGRMRSKEINVAKLTSYIGTDSSIVPTTLFIKGGNNEFMIVNTSSYFDGYSYDSVELHKLPR